LETIELPEILNIPVKLLPVIEKFNDYRYFLLEGGRGGGKTNAIGRFILYLANRYNVRVVCGRETQNTIGESVYALMADLIRKFQLNYEILSSSVKHNTKNSQVTFRGFRQQGAFNIQGMEGVDILWIDEAQAITKPTLDVLIPTIRKDNAKIFFSMNRHVTNDPVFNFLRGREDCLHIQINFDENQFCTEALKNEAAACKRMSEKDYKHIWLGEPLDQSEDSVFSLEEILNCKKNLHIPQEGYGLRVAGFDIARYGDDKCVGYVLQQTGALHWEEVFSEEWDHKDLNYTTGRILQISNEQGVDLAAVDEDGIGAGPFDTLSKGRGLDYFMKGFLHVKDQRLIDELQTVKYTFDHNQRRLLVSKDKMRKEGIKSPNFADALFMAASLMEQVQEKQAKQYQPSVYQPAQAGSLYDIAGVR
jgi:phage terminase large subunit